LTWSATSAGDTKTEFEESFSSLPSDRFARTRKVCGHFYSASERDLMLTDPNYNPSHLLDRATEKRDAMNDRQLAMRIGTGAPRLSRIRTKALPVSVGILICLNESTG
jgi:hypothetical protein